MDDTTLTRREALARGLAAVAGGAALATVPGRAFAAAPAAPRATTVSAEVLDSGTLAPGRPGVDYLPVITPNGVSLPWKVVGGVKIFHLVAEPVEHEFAPGLRASCWGYNGRTSGPTIEAVEGDRVRIYVTNKLPEATSIHWHGLFVPSGMDGVPGLSQAPIEVGQTFKYEFTLRQHGTFMYHPHVDEMVQQAMGMMGMFVIHPRAPHGRRADRDYALLSAEWRILPGTSRPDPNEMLEFNLFTFNSKVFPATQPLVAQRGDLVRIRLANLSATNHHPIHIHGHAWHAVGTDGGAVPDSARIPESSVLVPVGATRTMEFIADNPGDWAIHCHMTHHAMNQMGHPGVNLLGVKPERISRPVRALLPDYMTMGTDGMAAMNDMASMGMPLPKNSIPMLGADGKHGYIDMGGMLTVIKVREQLTNASASDWYENPPGTVAVEATSEELARDGVTTT